MIKDLVSLFFSWHSRNCAHATADRANWRLALARYDYWMRAQGYGPDDPEGNRIYCELIGTTATWGVR